MEMYLIKMFGISLGITLIIELVIARMWGLKSRKETILVILTNVFTNPAAVLVVWLARMYFGIELELFLQIPLEILVVFVEALIYVKFSKETDWNLKNPIGLAAVSNVVSWFSGVILQNVF